MIYKKLNKCIYVTPSAMRKIDEKTRTLYGIPSLILMENAGRSCAEEIIKDWTNGKTGFIYCGKGNNGGDGFVCARYLSNANFKIHVFILDAVRNIKSKDSMRNLQIIKKMKISIKEIDTINKLKSHILRFRCDFVVDAIFGFGFKGKLPTVPMELIRYLNNRNVYVYSVDIPSGMNALSGSVGNVCVRARKTITFGLPKKGFFKKGAEAFTGDIVVKDIGHPRILLKMPYR